MILFISGPMSNMPNYNRSAFFIAEAHLSELGHTVLNPANLIPICHPDAIPHKGYVTICRAMIDQCDAIVQLDGWEESKGAKAELYHAHEKLKQVMHIKEVPHAK